MTLTEDKERLRNEMHRQLADLSKERRTEGANLICGRILDSEVYTNANSVMVYLPLADEVDITPILENCLATEKLLSAPKIDWSSHTLTPIQIHDLQHDIRTGPHGVREPTGVAVVEPSDLDLLLVPALAFDADRRRLGRGGGFYDRFLEPLSQEGKPFTLGLGFDIQLVEKIPADGHDQRVDAVLTPSRWIFER